MLAKKDAALMTEYDKPKNDFEASDSPQKKKRNPLVLGCVALTIAVAVVCCMLPAAFFGIIAGLSAVAETNEVTDRRIETLVIEDPDQATLDIHNAVGETRIRGGAGDAITVEIVRQATALTKGRAEALLDEADVTVQEDNNRYVVDVSHQSFNFFDQVEVELLITVPDGINVLAENNVGALVVRDVNIRDQLRLENNVGGIEYDGKIGPRGSYVINNNIGGIKVNVDRESSFRLDATSDVGAVDASLSRFDGSTSRTTVGGIYGPDDEPDTTLTITVNVGGIQLSD